jgi:CRP/FNR family transcriptional regulator
LDGTRRHQAEADSQICETCGSRVAGLCRPLDIAALEDMSGESDQMTMPARATVFREGDPAGKVFTLIDGIAKLTRLLPDGKQQVVGFRYPGDIIGYTAKDTYPFDAELLTEARLCRLERGRMANLLKRYPTLESRLLDLCVQELAATQEQLVTVGRRTAEARVAAFVMSLVAARRRRGAVGRMLEMPMTRADIADFLGLTLETVSRTLTSFRKRGWIREPAHQRLELINVAALTALAEGTQDEV